MLTNLIYTSYIFCAIIACLHNNSLIGMEALQLSHSSFLSDGLDNVYSGFNKAILQKQEGKSQEAVITLIHSYSYAQKHGLLNSIEPFYLHGTCKYVGLPQIAARHNVTALAHKYAIINRSFLDGIRDYHTENIKTAATSLLQSYSYAQNNDMITLFNPLLLETVRKHLFSTQYIQKQYQSALPFADNTVQKLNLYSHIAKQAYTQGNFALGQECYENIFSLKKQISCIDTFVHYSRLAKEFATDGLSYYLSLMYLQDALISLAESNFHRSEAQKKRNLLEPTFTMLKEEALSKTIRDKAILLEKYFDIIIAIKTSARGLIEHLSNPQKKTSPAYMALMHLFAACINENITIDRAIDIMVNNPELIQFWDLEGNIAIPILERFLSKKNLSIEIKDLFHTFVGGYYYHNDNPEITIHHLKQCSTFENDLYLQALSAKIDKNPDTRKEKIKSIIPLLSKSFVLKSSTVKDNSAKKIIAEICGYNSSAPLHNTLSMCQELVILLAISGNNNYPLEYVRTLMALKDLNKKKNLLSPDQSKTITMLNIYFDFFSLLQAHDQKKLSAFFTGKNSWLKGIRRLVLETIAGHKKNCLQNIIFEQEVFEFNDNLIEILNQIIQYSQSHLKISSEECHYLMGGYAAQCHNYDQAFKHFLQCDLDNIYVRAKIVESSPIKDMLTTLESCISLLNSDREDDKTRMAKKIISNTINKRHKEYVDILLKTEDYEQAYKFVQCLADLNLSTTLEALCDAFATIEKAILQKPYDEYHAIMHMPAYAETYKKIETISIKNNNAAFCNKIASILKRHSKSIHLESRDKTILKRECCNYLSRSLKINNKITDSKSEKRRMLFGKLACCFGKIEKSISLLDEAIPYNPQALYEKAQLLRKQENVSSQDWLNIISLSEQHVASNDSDIRRGKSYYILGKYHFEHTRKRKALKYFKAAADLGNYDAAHLLALMYIDGTENNQTLNKEHALIHLQKTIELKKKSSYLKALYIRALIYYQDNKYAQAHEDLVTLLSFNEYDDSQKLFCHWLTGLTKLHLNENIDVSDEISSHFMNAYQIGLAHKLENPDSPFIKEFILVRDEKTLAIVQKNINHILENNKTDKSSVIFCTVMGSVLFEQCQTQPITDIVRQLAVKSLVYAAENGHSAAPFSLLKTDDKEVDCLDKIHYLEVLLFNNPHLKESINPALAPMYPTDVLSQATLITHFAKKSNPAVLQKYTSQLYEHRKPQLSAETIPYLLLPNDEIEQIMVECIGNPALLDTANNFLKNPSKSIPQEHFMAIFYGSLLTYSLNSELLLKGANYLEKSREFFPTIQKEDIEKNLGYIYYKLGLRQAELKNQDSAVIYFEKGADLGNQHCEQLLKQFSPHKPTQTKNCNKTNESTQQIRQGLQLVIVNTTETREKVNNLLEKQAQHPDYKHLISSSTDNHLKSNQKNNVDDIKIHETKSVTSFTYAWGFCNESENIQQENSQMAKKAIEYGFKDAIIKNSGHSNNLFISLSSLGHLCSLVEIIITKKSTMQTNLLLRTIKKELMTHNINIKAFERFYKSFFKGNLTSHKHWSK